jgi:hypothetical protein
MGRALLVLESPADRQKAVTWIGKAPVGTRVEFKASKRTLPQNDLLWALLTEFAQRYSHNGTKYEPGQWKAIFLHAFGREISFLPSLDGKTFLPIEMSSSDLSKQEMTDFIEFIIKEAAERGIVLHNPKDTDSGTSSPDEPDDAESAALASPQEAELPPSPGSASNTFEWLPTVARMLWAATHDRGDVEDNLAILNNQRMACNALDHEGPTQEERDKAGSIYRVCKEVVMRTVKRADAMKIIAGHAGIEIGGL